MQFNASRVDIKFEKLHERTHAGRVKALFERIEREHGVDILVSNAAVIHDEMMGRTKFWEEPLTVLDTLDVGVRSTRRHRIRGPFMVTRRQGLVVFT